MTTDPAQGIPPRHPRWTPDGAPMDRVNSVDALREVARLLAAEAARIDAEETAEEN